MWKAEMDGAESGCCGVAFKSDGESFVGQSQAGVAEP
jgi:hypothetical protein